MILFTNIKELLQVRKSSEKLIRGADMKVVPRIEDAWLAAKDGVIEAFGEMAQLDMSSYSDYELVDVKGKLIFPTYIDSHTHLVFADWRNQEFVDRIEGKTYQEIAARGGGILNSAQKMADASEDELFDAAMFRLEGLIKQGTGAIEIKSGYGLSKSSELKMLRVIQRIKQASPIPVKSTFLGAHAVPEAYKGNTDGFVDHIIEDILPEVSNSSLADYIDAFCEEGYFSAEHTRRILEAGKAHGLKGKIHVNQFNAFGGVKTCVDHDCLTVDHLEELTNADIDALKGSATIPVALPSCSFFLSIPYTPARSLMEAGLPLALATDFNPGSTPSGNMNFVFSLACIKMGMTPEEALNALTLNAAACMELENEVGSITTGKRANLIVSKEVNDLSYLPYSFGESQIDAVYINGNLQA